MKLFSADLASVDNYRQRKHQRTCTITTNYGEKRLMSKAPASPETQRLQRAFQNEVSKCVGKELEMVHAKWVDIDQVTFLSGSKRPYAEKKRKGDPAPRPYYQVIRDKANEQTPAVREALQSQRQRPVAVALAPKSISTASHHAIETSPDHLTSKPHDNIPSYPIREDSNLIRLRAEQQLKEIPSQVKNLKQTLQLIGSGFNVESFRNALGTSVTTRSEQKSLKGIPQSEPGERRFDSTIQIPFQPDRSSKPQPSVSRRNLPGEQPDQPQAPETDRTARDGNSQTIFLAFSAPSSHESSRSHTPDRLNSSADEQTNQEQDLETEWAVRDTPGDSQPASRASSASSYESSRPNTPDRMNSSADEQPDQEQDLESEWADRETPVDSQPASRASSNPSSHASSRPHTTDQMNSSADEQPDQEQDLKIKEAMHAGTGAYEIVTDENMSDKRSITSSVMNNLGDQSTIQDSEETVGDGQSAFASTGDKSYQEAVNELNLLRAEYPLTEFDTASVKASTSYRSVRTTSPSLESNELAARDSAIVLSEMTLEASAESIKQSVNLDIP